MSKDWLRAAQTSHFLESRVGGSIFDLQEIDQNILWVSFQLDARPSQIENVMWTFGQAVDGLCYYYARNSDNTFMSNDLCFCAVREFIRARKKKDRIAAAAADVAMGLLSDT